jgi:cytochrome c oxidase assembly factor CtaG
MLEIKIGNWLSLSASDIPAMVAGVVIIAMLLFALRRPKELKRHRNLLKKSNIFSTRDDKPTL